MAPILETSQLMAPGSGFVDAFAGGGLVGKWGRGGWQSGVGSLPFSSTLLP